MEQQSSSPHKIQTELTRELGLTSALAIGVGTMIAAGIFTLSGLAIRNVGSAAVVSFLLAAVVATFTALSYCEFVSIYPRSGEGYLYARKTFPAPLAYFVGWALLLGYASSCAFYISSLSSYFHEFIWESPIKSVSGIVILIALTLLNIKGTKESGSFQVIVTIVKVLLLIWFVVGGISKANSEELIAQFNEDIFEIAGTAAMVFITFFGFSAIAASAGEVINPVKNIPRAIFISMGIVTVLYTLVVIAVLAADLTEYTEAAMGNAAKFFLGPIGGMVIVAGALFSMISASNASIMAGSRVALSMSNLGHLPEEIGMINERTRTPIISLMLVGGMIMLFAIILPLEDLAHFADTVLLLVLILVNAALILHRRKFPTIERPFKVPLVPLLPVLGILANLYLLSQITAHPLPMILALVSLLLGMLAFLAWKGTQAGEEAIPGAPSKVALGRYAVSGDEKKFRILLPVANPANISRLMEIASAIAIEKKGEVIALRVAIVPEQMPLSHEYAYIDDEKAVLEATHVEADRLGVPLTSLLSIGHHTGRAIIETSRKHHCNLILMGWKGFTTSTQKILGENADAVVQHARCDIMMVKLPPNGDLQLKNLLLPTAGGDHAKKAEQYAAALSQYMGGSLTVHNIIPPDAKPEKEQEAQTRVKEAVDRIKEVSNVQVDSKITRHESIPEGVLEAAEGYDAIVVGATRDSIYPQIVFGTIPEKIARNSTKPVILVKHFHRVKDLLGRVMGE